MYTVRFIVDGYYVVRPDGVPLPGPLPLALAQKWAADLNAECEFERRLELERKFELEWRNEISRQFEADCEQKQIESENGLGPRM